jgi:hypothetical protein
VRPFSALVWLCAIVLAPETLLPFKALAVLLLWGLALYAVLAGKLELGEVFRSSRRR